MSVRPAIPPGRGLARGAAPLPPRVGQGATLLAASEAPGRARLARGVRRVGGGLLARLPGPGAAHA